jgi:hypothetical protein
MLKSDRQTIAQKQKGDFKLPSFQEQQELDTNRDSTQRIETAKLAISCWCNISSKLMG